MASQPADLSAGVTEVITEGSRKMSAPKGRIVPIAPMRRFVMDLVYFAHQVPTVPVSRVIDVSDLAAARLRTQAGRRGRCSL